MIWNKKSFNVPLKYNLVSSLIDNHNGRPEINLKAKMLGWCNAINWQYAF